MRSSHAIAIVGSLLVLASCRSTHRQPAEHRWLAPDYGVAPSVSQDASAGVRQLLDGIMSADNAGDLDRVMTHYTDDAMLLPPKGPSLSGREAIRAHYVEAFQALTLSMSATIDELRSANGWAMVRGQVRGTIVEKSNGSSRQAHDRYLGIADRGADGRWRFSRLTWGSTD